MPVFLYTIRVGLPLSPILFVVLIDRILRYSQEEEGGWFGNRVESLLLAEDVALLSFLSHDLQQSKPLEQFAAEWEAAVMNVSLFKFEAMVLNWEKVKWKSLCILGSFSQVTVNWRKRLQIQTSKMSFFLMVARLSLRNRVMRLTIQRELRVELLLLCI